MYYVNREQVGACLAFVPFLIGTSEELQQAAARGSLTLLEQLAQERVLHLAIETVTDVGSLLIDGYLMRDASSYEDIVEILGGEAVFSAGTAAQLKELVKLRKPLVQDYAAFRRDGLNPLIKVLPSVLRDFTQAVQCYLEKEQ